MEFERGVVVGPFSEQDQQRTEIPTRRCTNCWYARGEGIQGIRGVSKGVATMGVTID